MRVVVGVAQLIRQGVEEEIAPFCVKVTSQAHKNVQGGLVHGVALWPRLVLVDGLKSRTHARQCAQATLQVARSTLHAQPSRQFSDIPNPCLVSEWKQG